MRTSESSCLLGSGEYGMVYKGRFIPLESLDTIQVAVKTLKSNATTTHVMSLLNELKVLSYLDNGHKNVLHLVCAHTANARYGKKKKLLLSAGT